MYTITSDLLRKQDEVKPSIFSTDISTLCADDMAMNDKGESVRVVSMIFITSLPVDVWYIMPERSKQRGNQQVVRHRECN